MVKTIQERFEKLSLSSIVQANQNRGVMAGDIQPVWPGRICGKVFPVDIQPEYEKIPENLIENIEENTILVVGAYGFASSFLDEVEQCRLKKNGIAAVITDGMIRNAANWKAINLPVFSKGINDRLQNGKKDAIVKSEILCGGIIVSKGDYVFADSDGVVVVPEKDLEDVLKTAEEIECHTQALIEKLNN